MTTTAFMNHTQAKPPELPASSLPGIALTLGIALLAYPLGLTFPLVGGPVFALLAGLALRAVYQPHLALRPGISFASKQGLQAAIVMMGFGLSLAQVLGTGPASLLVMVSTLVVCLGAALVLGPRFGVGENLTMLIGAGTSICGASAIAAVAPVIKAEERDVAYGIATIFTFNIMAVLLFPAAGHLLGFSQEAFGLWAGTAINDTSSVVAAAYAYGPEAGAYAVVVKLARATMIIPLVVGIAAWRSARAESTTVQWQSLIPWFILLFLAAALANTAGLVPGVVAQWLPLMGRFLIIVALAGVGLSADLRSLSVTGWRPLALGAALWVVVTGTSLLVQFLVGII
jgi:uncharacterized integral membrane protein (TIGR00698 family)